MLATTAFVIAVVSVVLNLLVPRLAQPLVKMLPGAATNDFLLAANKMFAFHIDSPVVSSVVVALLVFLSVVLAAFLPM
jgi:hypothetical protein